MALERRDPMTPETIFHFAQPLALAGWGLLLLAPLIPKIADRAAGYGIPIILGLIYVAMMVAYLPDGEGGFASLPEVMQLFTVPGLAMAGWLHYLAFDLFIGGWEVRTARREGISHWLVLPCLALTLLAGPIGLLLFLTLRFGLHRWRTEPAQA